MIVGTTKERAWYVVPDMWTVPSWDTPVVLSGGRPSLIVPADVESVSLEGTYDALPLVSEWRDDVENGWKRYEMPLPKGDERDGPQSEAVRLLIHSHSGETEFVNVMIRDGTPHPEQDGQLDEEESRAAYRPNRWVLAGLHAMRMIAEHVDWAKRLFDQPVADSDRLEAREPWDRRAGGMAAPSVGRVLEQWKQNRGDDPRLAVIVEIARKHESVIRSICQRPRRVLARSRQVVRLDRVQEIDSGCMRWLARQPGRSVAERAGVHQRVMGVVRLESAETPENRVVKDFLKKAIAACRRYQREYRDFPEHPRVKLVARFRRALIDLLLNSEVSGVRPLVGVAQPNYVLQHDSRYRVLWREYVRLVREQSAEDDLWRWQHRAWQEVCSIACQAILADWCEMGSALRSEVWLHGEQKWGQFVSPSSMPGRSRLRENALVGRGGVIDFIDGRAIGREDGETCLPIDCQQGLRPLAPDFVLLRLTENDEPVAVVPVWTIFDFDVADDRLELRTTGLCRQLASMQRSVPIRGLILQPALTGSSTALDYVEVDHCLGIRLSLPVQTGLDDLALVLWESLA